MALDFILLRGTVMQLQGLWFEGSSYRLRGGFCKEKVIGHLVEVIEAHWDRNFLGRKKCRRFLQSFIYKAGWTNKVRNH